MVNSINHQLPTASCWCAQGPTVRRIPAPAVTEARLLSHRGMEAAYFGGMLLNLGFIIEDKSWECVFHIE